MKLPLLIALPWLLVACVSAELSPGAGSPDDVNAPQTPVQPLPPTLEPGFDPLAGAHESHSEHEHHADPSTTYACPMHPEVRSGEPGRCPKCGMKLEPVGGPQ